MLLTWIVCLGVPALFSICGFWCWHSLEGWLADAEPDAPYDWQKEQAA